MQRKRVGILVFDDVEVLDFCGPFEVFSVTRLDEGRRREEPSPFDVFLIGETAAPVITTGGMRVTPAHDFATCPPLALLVVPGGWGTRAQMHNDALGAWVRERGAAAELVASVCTGALVLGKAGFLDGRRATTHWQALDLLAQTVPAATVERRQHVVEDGTVVTSAGIAAGIDLALRLVARYHGEAVARRTARYMEYPYPESNDRRV